MEQPFNMVTTLLGLQARALILGPCWGTKVGFLSFNRTQSRVVTGLLTLLTPN
jgi:hypothetical protein